MRATYFAGPEAVITKRIRLNVSPAIRLGLRPKGDVAAGAKVRAVGVLRGRWKADRKVCFYVDGHKFDCDTSGRGGRARVGYRAKEPGKLRFYAKVSNQRDYPYTRGRSATKTKIVR